jgi:hypothetical protein
VIHPAWRGGEFDDVGDFLEPLGVGDYQPADLAAGYRGDPELLMEE